MSYSKEEIVAARRTNLVEWLQDQGYDLKKQGKDWRVIGYNGLFARGNSWKDFYNGTGGNTLDFLIKVEGMTFSEAMKALIGSGLGSVAVGSRMPHPVAFQVPKKNKDYRRVIAYLAKTRKIPFKVVIKLIKAGLLWQDEKGNCVFPLKNTRGEIVGAFLRGTLSDRRWRGTSPGSRNELGWCWPGSSSLAVVESPIEAMSLKQIHSSLESHTFVALGGLHINVFTAAVKHIKPEHIIIALNGDDEAKKATKTFRGWLRDQGYSFDVLMPINNDWNDDLIYTFKKKGET